MGTTFSRILFLLLFFYFSSNSQVCDSIKHSCGSTFDKSPAGIMIGHPHPKGVWMLSYRFMFMNMNDLLENGIRVDQRQIFNSYLMAPSEMQMQMHMLMIMYGISARFSVMAMANYQAQAMHMDMFSSVDHSHVDPDGQHNHDGMHASTHGLSDTKLTFIFKALERTEHRILASIGFSIPTGIISKTGDSNSMFPGLRQAYMMQNGTGTVDIQPGITYLLDQKKWSVGFQAFYTIRPYKNKYLYRYGNELELNVWLARQLGSSFSASLRSLNLVSGAISGADPGLYVFSEPATNPVNYGGFKSALLAGLNLHIPQSFLPSQKIGLEAGRCLFQRGKGIQLASRWNININWTLTF